MEPRVVRDVVRMEGRPFEDRQERDDAIAQLPVPLRRRARRYTIRLDDGTRRYAFHFVDA